jgi:hypothetical protein
LRLRAPAVLFGALWLIVLFALGLTLATWAASGLTAFEPAAGAALALPVAVASGLAGLMVRKRFQRAPVPSAIIVIWRAASAFGAMGLAWPLSFGVSALMQGDANTALVQAVASPIVAILAALAGAVSGAVATSAAMRKGM